MSNLSSRQLLLAKLAIDLDNVPTHELDDYIAVQNFLADEDSFPSDAISPAEQFSCYLSAFYHLRKVNDVERINLILAEVPGLTAYINEFSKLVALLNQQTTDTGKQDVK